PGAGRGGLGDHRRDGEHPRRLAVPPAGQPAYDEPAGPLQGRRDWGRCDRGPGSRHGPGGGPPRRAGGAARAGFAGVPDPGRLKRETRMPGKLIIGLALLPAAALAAPAPLPRPAPRQQKDDALARGRTVILGTCLWKVEGNTFEDRRADLFWQQVTDT